MSYPGLRSTRLVKGLLMPAILLILTLICLCLTACLTTPESDADLGPTVMALATENSALAVENATLIAEQPTIAVTNPSPSRTAPEIETEVRPTATLLPTATPAATVLPTDAPASIPVCQPDNGWLPYIVQPGDTLFAIARRVGSSVEELKNGNCLGDASRIDVGQQLTLPALPPTAAAPTAMPTIPTETAAPTIHSFTLVSDEMVGEVRRVTLSWDTSGGQARLQELTRHRFFQWLDVPASGTHTFELRGTVYEDPPISLSVLPAGNSDEGVHQIIYLSWACEHSYFFGYVPERCARGPSATTLAGQQDFENGRMLWLSDLDEIFVLYGNGDWKKYDNRWQEGDPPDDPEIQPPPGLFQPIRGFGDVWRNQNQYDAVRERLGWGVAPEQSYTATYQHSIAESAGQNILYLTLQDGVTVYQLAGYDVGQGSWSILAAND